MSFMTTSISQYSNFECHESLVKFYFLCVSANTEMRRVWSSTCLWPTLPSVTGACAMAPMTSRTIVGSRTWTGSNWVRSAYQCHSSPRLAAQVTLRTSRSILTRIRSPLRSPVGTTPSSTGERQQMRHRADEREIEFKLYNNNQKDYSTLKASQSTAQYLP